MGITVERLDDPTGLDIPEFDGVIIASRCKQRPIR